ncbi:MAG TPA: hypothetical protein VN081_02400 [Dongiaceae bacterium]|nr:hypothetical protein [Dongiaceae bacterium]
MIKLDCDKKRAEMLYAELGKVRCWLSGFAAARPNELNNSPPGYDSLRQLQQLLSEAKPVGKQ